MFCHCSMRFFLRCVHRFQPQSKPTLCAPKNPNKLLINTHQMRQYNNTAYRLPGIFHRFHHFRHRSIFNSIGCFVFLFILSIARICIERSNNAFIISSRVHFLLTEWVRVGGGTLTWVGSHGIWSQNSYFISCDLGQIACVNTENVVGDLTRHISDNKRAPHENTIHKT